MTASLTPSLLDQLERRLKEATPGEWAVDGRFIVTRDPIELEYERAAIADLDYFHMPYDRANALLIVEMKNALPALISALRSSLVKGEG